jgi:hypothetical protein
MTKSPRIVVFEDRQENFDRLDSELSRLLQGAFSVERYPGHRKIQGSQWQEAERWVREALTAPDAALLAVLDWDLSSYEHPASHKLVRGLAQDMAIPLVVYQGDLGGNAEQFERLRRWQEGRIAVEGTSDYKALAEMVALAARGFDRINAHFREAKIESLRLLDATRELLCVPDGTPPLHLEEYTIGGQDVLVQTRLSDVDIDRRRFAATTVGYLIYNRILEFPGPILDRVATAAYLSIDPSELQRGDVIETIEAAAYRGPFHERDGWWRTELEAFLFRSASDDDASLPTGHRILESALSRKLKPAICHDGEALDEQAYKCILTRSIVCRRHSVAPEAWIPGGADRCRVSSDEFALLQAWLGI